MKYDLGTSLLQHFQELEAGTTHELHQLQALCIQRNNKEIQAKPPVQHIALKELPTLVEVEDHCLRQRPHKAPGPDGVPSSLCRSGSAAIAPQIHAMICKSFIMGIENPSGIREVNLCTIFKQKGARDDAAAYRGILLADSFAKSDTRMDPPEAPPGDARAQKTIGQLGGLPSQQTLTGIQILKLHSSVLQSCSTFNLHFVFST